jgi:peroxiredoxin
MRKLYILVFYLFFSFQVLHAQKAPDFSFTDIDGIERNLYQTLDEGKMVFLQFFFVECGPCQSWATQVQPLSEKLEGYNVEIWALSSADNSAAVRKFMKTNGYSWISGGMDGGSHQAISKFKNMFMFMGYPTYMVICPDRTVSWDVWPVSFGLPEIENALENCGLTKMTSGTSGSQFVSGLRISPNPITDYGRVEFNLRRGSHVKVEVFNLIGKKVLDVADEMRDAGPNSIILDLNDVPRGQYFIRVQIGNSETRVLKITRITP